MKTLFFQGRNEKKKIKFARNLPNMWNAKDSYECIQI